MTITQPSAEEPEGSRPRAKLGSLVMIALRSGSLPTLEALLKGSFDPKSVDGKGRTALVIAAEYGHVAIGRCLLDRGVNPASTDLNDRTARDVAIASGRDDFVAMLDGWISKNDMALLNDSTAAPAVTDEPTRGPSDSRGEALSSSPVSETEAFEADPSERVAHAAVVGATEAGGNPDRRASTDFFDFHTLNWEINDTEFVASDGTEIIASVEQTQREFGAPLQSDGVDWEGISIALPSVSSYRGSGLPEAVFKPIRTALRDAAASGILTPAIRFPGGLTDSQTAALLQCVTATAEAAGITVANIDDIWWQSPGSTATESQVDEAEIASLIAHFESTWAARFAPSLVDREIVKMGRLIREDEEALFARLEASQKEAYHDLSSLPQVRKFLLDAHDLVMAGALDFNFLSGAELEPEDAPEGEAEFEWDQVDFSDDAKVLPESYSAAIEALRGMPGGRLTGAIAIKAGTALRNLELTPEALGWIGQTFALDEAVGTALSKCHRKNAETDRIREQVLVRHLPLARHIAKNLLADGLEIDDLTQEATFGLIRAIELFDPSLGNRFATYASMWCWQRVQRSIADQHEFIRVPVHARSARLRFLEIVADVEVGGDPNQLSIANVQSSCGVSPQVAESFLFNQKIEPIDAATSLANPHVPSQFDTAAHQNLRRIVAQLLGEVPERNATILRMRFGLMGSDDHTLEEVGELYGVTRERIRQIEAKTLKALAGGGRAKWLRTAIDL